MSKKDLIYPEEGELVIVTVHSVKQNGADVSLDEYEGVDGFIFIGEIASGWIKTSDVLFAKDSDWYAKSCQVEEMEARSNCH